MARQIPQANGSSNFDANAWFAKWHEERTKYRSWLLVTVDEPLRANDGVSVYVFAHLDARDALKCYLDPRYRNKGYEVARCLFGEQLTGYTASRLTTILSIIRHFQYLS